MNLKLEIEFSKADLLHEVDVLKQQVDDMRPLPEDVEGRVMQKLRLDWNYHSNAIEGNKLTYGETIAFLMEGITAKGKPLKDHLDIRGHNEAIKFLLSIVKDRRPFSEADIRNLHSMILVEPYDVKARTAEGLPTTKRITLGEYKTMPNHVLTATGETHYYATPEETPAKMQELMEWYNEAINNADIHPLVVAALFHHKFVSIHPFDDGNGRLSRILINLILMQKGYPPVVVKMDDRQNYYSLLSRADSNDSWPFIEYISERLSQSLKLYLKAAGGGDINEDEDIDKEIALLQMQLKGGVVAPEKKTKINVEKIFYGSIVPLINKLQEKSSGLHDFFFHNSFEVYLSEINGYRQRFMQNEVISKAFTWKSQWNILEIVLNKKFSEYKDPNNTFKLEISISIKFDEFYYHVISGTNIIASKLYHEELLPADQNEIIKVFIQNFKIQIEEELKNPKS